MTDELKDLKFRAEQLQFIINLKHTPEEYPTEEDTWVEILCDLKAIAVQRYFGVLVRAGIVTLAEAFCTYYDSSIFDLSQEPEESLKARIGNFERRTGLYINPETFIQYLKQATEQSVDMRQVRWTDFVNNW